MRRRTKSSTSTVSTSTRSGGGSAESMKAMRSLALLQLVEGRLEDRNDGNVLRTSRASLNLDELREIQYSNHDTLSECEFVREWQKIFVRLTCIHRAETIEVAVHGRE